MSREQQQGPDRPKRMTVRDDTVPSELKDILRWTAWRWERANGEWAAAPVGSLDDAGTFEEAVARYRAEGHDGVGLFLTGDGFCAIRVTHCHDPKRGVLSEQAVDLLQRVTTYAELSPSGTGVTILARGLLPDLTARKGHVEVAAGGTFLPVTGWRLPSSGPAVEPHQPELLRLFHDLREYVLLSDDEVLAQARRARNRNKFIALWEGDTAGYADPTRADLALCAILGFWTGGHPGRTEALFGRSALARGRKWGRDADYRRATLNQALAGLTAFYRPGVVTRNSQEETGLKNTARRDEQEAQGGDRPTTPCAVVTRSSQEETGVNNNCDGLAPAEVVEQARQLARDLAETAGPLADREATFALARRLRTLADDKPQQFGSAVRLYCELTGRPTEGVAWGDFYYDYLVAWEKVRWKEGETSLIRARALARQQPYTLPCSVEPLDELTVDIAGLAWHLSKQKGNKPFQLTRELLAELYGVSPMSISRRVGYLAKNGIVLCVDADYSYTKKKAKDYKFVGPEPVHSPAQTPPTLADAGPARQLPQTELLPPPPLEVARRAQDVRSTARTAPPSKCRLGKKQTKKCPFKSKYGERWLSAGQFLAEEMCARLARKEGGDLPSEFWTVPKWESRFFHQLRQAMRLLKTYDQKAVFAALRTDRGKTKYSLAAPAFEELVKAEQERLNLKKVLAGAQAKSEPALAPEPESDLKRSEAPRPAFIVKPSPLTKLRDL